MDGDTAHEATVPYQDFNPADPEVDLTNIDSLEGILSSGGIAREIGTAGEVITRIEQHVACSSEKLVNLNILMMHVATRESDFEAFVSDKEHMLSDSVGKAMEFDILSGILDSEVRELGNFMSTLQTEIINAREIIFSCKHLGQDSKDMEDKLDNSEESLKQSLDQVPEIRVQSANFQRILSSFGGEENWKSDKGVDFLGSGGFLDQNAKIKMQTFEQQRDFLRTLEKSLARELDLEKKLGESGQIVEELKLMLHSSEQDVFFMEEAAAVVWERLFEAENAAEVSMGISKEILGRLQIVQFNLNGSIQREENLRFELKDSMEKLKAKDSATQKLEDKLAVADSEAFTLREKVISLEKHLKECEFKLLNAKPSVDESQTLHSEISETEKAIKDLKELISTAESRADSAEAKCKLLTEINMKLNEDLGLLKGSASEEVDSLERQLRESDIQLQHALASAEASQEKQTMLYSTIHDMENLIENLKLRVSKAESRAESAEVKCITLSESNSDLNEELSFLRNRLECLEASLHQAKETKMATAKDIGIQTKIITNLVMQLALERERLHNQISSLTKENKILLQQAGRDPCSTMSHDGRGTGEDLSLSRHGFSTATCLKESKEEASDFSATSVEEGKKRNNGSVGEAELGPADSRSKLETVRNIDARQLNFNYVLMAALMLAISALAAFLFQHSQYQFS